MRPGHRTVPSRSTTTGLAIGLTLFGGIGLVSQACRSPTQVTLDVTYRGPCKEVAEVGFIISTDPFVAASRIETNVFTTSVSGASCTPGVGGAPSRIGTLVVTPNDDTDHASIIVMASFGQALSACKAANGYFGCIIARRAFVFVKSSALTLEVSLDPDCKNVPCDAVSTCSKGACVSSSVDCNGDGCSAPGVTSDGGTIFVDAATNSDAFAQGDRVGPPTDGAADAPVEAGRCEQPKENVTCATFTVTKSCAANESCCYGTSGGSSGSSGSTGASGASGASGSSSGGPIEYDCRSSGCFSGSMSNPIIQCRSARNCPLGNLCCVSPFPGAQPFCATTCGGSGGSSGSTGSTGGFANRQLCADACECENGGACVSGSAIGLDPPQPMMSCAQ